jgi:hypothetical protein
LKLNCARAALLFSLLPSANQVFGATLSSAWSMGIAPYQGGTPQVTVNNGPTTVTTQQLGGPGPHVCPGCPTIPGYSYDSTSSALLFGSATEDAAHDFFLHGFVQSSDSFTSGPQAPAPGLIGAASSFANFGFNFTDAIHFSSSTLVTGTPISFTLTEFLDSTISATAAGTCNKPVGLGYAPAASASIAFFLGDGSFLMNGLNHDSCGLGSDQMSLSGTFQSTVGGTFGFRGTFALSSSAGASNAPTGTTVNGQTTVDASNTGFMTLQVLTPGVTFTSDSGAAYAGVSAVPEPATGWLFVLGAALFVSQGLNRLYLRGSLRR